MITERVLISALMRAFSPMVSEPSELILPSILPSTTRSLENLMVPLISTSELRTLRPLGLGEDERGAGLLLGLLLGADGEGCEDALLLLGVSFLAEPVDGAADSGFCPITFWNTINGFGCYVNKSQIMAYLQA